jgi:hypothetical protein
VHLRVETVVKTGSSPPGTAARLILRPAAGLSGLWSNDFPAATWVSHTNTHASVRTEGTMVITNVSRIVESVDDLRDALEPWTVIGLTAVHDTSLQMLYAGQSAAPEAADGVGRAVVACKAAPNSAGPSADAELLFNCADLERTYAELSRRTSSSAAAGHGAAIHDLCMDEALGLPAEWSGELVFPSSRRQPARGLYSPLEQIVQVFDFLRAPSTVICDFSGIVALIHWSARS